MHRVQVSKSSRHEKKSTWKASAFSVNPKVFGSGPVGPHSVLDKCVPGYYLRRSTSDFCSTVLFGSVLKRWLKLNHRVYQIYHTSWWVFPSKIEWDLTNGPLSKLVELLDTQVFPGSIQWVLLEISWSITNQPTPTPSQNNSPTQQMSGEDGHVENSTCMWLGWPHMWKNKGLSLQPWFFAQVKEMQQLFDGRNPKANHVGWIKTLKIAG